MVVLGYLFCFNKQILKFILTQLFFPCFILPCYLIKIKCDFFIYNITVIQGVILRKYLVLIKYKLMNVIIPGTSNIF